MHADDLKKFPYRIFTVNVCVNFFETHFDDLTTQLKLLT